MAFAPLAMESGTISSFDLDLRSRIRCRHKKMDSVTRPPASLNLRKHPRALVNLPVRIRWRGPLGTRLEITHTIDVAREGLLVRRAEPCELDTRVWVAFPYDPREPAPVQPETPATVMRVDRDRAGSFRVALRLNIVKRQLAWPPARERRRDLRLAFALPILVRPVGSPWPEESMTRDISRSGARFETSHIYAPGDELFGKILWGDWEKAGEIRGRVVRVESAEDSLGMAAASKRNVEASAVFTCVAVQWIEPN
jgi:PilZ domain